MSPRAIGALHFDQCIFHPDIFQFNILFKKEPVGNAHPDLMGVHDGIHLPVFYQHILQVHVVEKREVDMFNLHPGLEIMGKPLGYLAGDPVLSKRGLNKYP